MLRELIKLADHLDRKGLAKEADFLDKIVRLSSMEGLLVPQDDSIVPEDHTGGETIEELDRDYKQEFMDLYDQMNAEQRHDAMTILNIICTKNT